MKHLLAVLVKRSNTNIDDFFQDCNFSLESKKQLVSWSLINCRELANNWQFFVRETGKIMHCPSDERTNSGGCSFLSKTHLDKTRSGISEAQILNAVFVSTCLTLQEGENF